jgi:hypothetical protein
MTVVRRELSPSGSASRPNPRTRRRIASARALRSCPHRAAGDAAQKSHGHDRPQSSGSPTCLLRRPTRRLAAGHRGPGETHQCAGNGGHGDGRALAMAHEVPVAPVQTLLGAPGALGDRAGLVLAAPGQGAAKAGAMAIVLDRFHEGAPRMTAAMPQRARPNSLKAGSCHGLRRRRGGMCNRHFRSPPLLSPIGVPLTLTRLHPRVSAISVPIPTGQADGRARRRSGMECSSVPQDDRR